MKSHHSPRGGRLRSVMLILSLISQAFADQPILRRVSAQTLVELQKRDPMVRLVKPAEGETRVSSPVNQSIIQDSTILHDGRHWTLVPHGAVVHLPESRKSHVSPKPVGTVLPWSDFLARNPSWLATDEVSFAQAADAVELPAERARVWLEQDKVVIAVHQSGPISVRYAKVATLSPQFSKR